MSTVSSHHQETMVAGALATAVSIAVVAVALMLLSGCAHEQPLVLTPTAAAVPSEPPAAPKKPAKAKAATVSKPATPVPPARPAPAVVSVPATEGSATPAAAPAIELEGLGMPESPKPAEPEQPKAPALDDLSELCVELGYPAGGDAFTQCRVRWGRARSLWATVE